MSITSSLKNHLPPALVSALKRGKWSLRRKTDFLRLCGDYWADARRYTRWSHTGAVDPEPRQRDFALLKAYHSLEKGLSMGQPRPGFGRAKVLGIVEKTEEWKVSNPPGGTGEASTASLQAYRAFNSAHDIQLPRLDAWLQATTPADPDMGGIEAVTRADVEAAVAGVTADFFTSRHSMRNFGPGEVPMEDIERAVTMAQKAPSVCNRQGARVYCFTTATDALKHQPGNGGFGHTASRGMVVTCDLQAFSSVGERHQAYVDGGLFAMSLVYALHSMGHGSCMLAWSSRAERERELRKTLQIPDSEVVIMMIAVGRLPETFHAARAWRKPLSDVLIVR